MTTDSEKLLQGSKEDLFAQIEVLKTKLNEAKNMLEQIRHDELCCPFPDEECECGVSDIQEWLKENEQ